MANYSQVPHGILQIYVLNSKKRYREEMQFCMEQVDILKNQTN